MPLSFVIMSNDANGARDASIASSLVARLAAALFVFSCAPGCSLEALDCELRNDCNRCDPARAPSPIADDCGFFVSASAGDDAQGGTKERPVRTLARAIELARARTSHVYACAETFEESVTLPSGIVLFGGFDCHRGFAFPNDARATTIAPPPDAVGVTVTPGEATARLQHVAVRAADATLPGGSSVAVLALPGSRLRIVQGAIVAGSGGHGVDGAHGSREWTTAPSGVDGASGDVTCGQNDGIGGEAPAIDCGSLVSMGGRGGTGLAIEDAEDGDDGFPASEDPGAGLGGEGQSSVAACTSGADGSDGAHGEVGRGGRGRGSLLASAGYIGEDGEDGRSGAPGQGGGGGGASTSLQMCPIDASGEDGAGGGAGGTGGCSGAGGLGGSYGGASLGIVAIFAEVSLDAVEIRTGRGGDGGDGGAPELGGKGGVGGLGGLSVFGISPGCDGGRGGRGGDGGYGGGGAGGPSIGVAFVGAEPKQSRLSIVTAGGGRGGDAPTHDGQGEDGLSSELLAFD